MSYIGPAPKGTSVYLSGTGTGDGATTVFPMGFTARADAEVIVTLDGVVQHTSAYTISGSNCTFSAAPAGSVAIEFRILQALGFVAEVGDGAVNQSKIDTSSLNPIVQQVKTVDNTMSTIVTTAVLVPYDDTIPQNTEGTEYITVTITPKSATNKLIIEGMFHYSCSVAGVHITAALYQDSIANALSVGWLTTENAANYNDQIHVKYEMVAGTTSAITFKVRLGGHAASTITLNGASGARKYGGVVESFLKVTEIAQ